jgi:predicted transposase YdaD
MLKGGENEATIREALSILRASEQLNELETVLAFFATFVLDIELVQEIMRWDMAVLRESPWYQEILREGQTLGRREEVLSNIETSLEVRFGTSGLLLMPQISQIQDLERLKSIFRNVIVATSADELQQLM